MTYEYFALVGTVIFGIGIVLFFLNKKFSSLSKNAQNETLFEWLKSMQASLDATNNTIREALRSSSVDMTKVLQENSKQLNERLDKAAYVIKEVGKEVGAMSEIGRSIKELQEAFKNPKLRGNIGEQVLKDLISQMFPKNSFFLQYQFKSGDRVDAAIKTDAGILSIDSKFPMEHYSALYKAENEEKKEEARKEFTQDIKKHIDTIAKKYVLPSEGTMDFALMYIPSEGVYYELINTTDLLEYARKLRVYVVSPNTLYAHLQTILLSFEGKKIELQSREVLRLLRTLRIDYQKIGDNLDVLGKHLTNASSQFSNVSVGFGQFGNKLTSSRHLEKANIEQIEHGKGGEA
ncbi:MAG: hypothetical protein A3J69_02700 [Candidatus Levybacteria bacterium RIFCSPHIGHO2_02_FULL_42_12]|nr:MAG: hypothetical protein A3J69_02700 [Candidatus Levybacteria bacterium RIFCSPHIGHO2_02_FULL_42_12]